MAISANWRTGSRTGIPPIVSVSYDLLKGREKDNDPGHLMVCDGFTATGDIVLNDPAYHPDKGERCRRVFPRCNFLKAGRAPQHRLSHLPGGRRDSRQPLRRLGVDRLTDFDIEFVKEIAREAGDRALTMLDAMEPEYKADGSFVTHIDRQTEEFIRGRLADRYPDYSFQGEEFGRFGETERPLWCVDPIDGTTNMVFGLTHWCVSIGLVEGGERSAGALYIPLPTRCTGPCGARAPIATACACRSQTGLPSTSKIRSALPAPRPRR